MKLRTGKCRWCGKEYVEKDSNASVGGMCSEACAKKWRKAREKYEEWWEELDDAWDKYARDYEPEKGEMGPYFLAFPFHECPYNRREYEAFQERYRAWKHNHCWKLSFWEWDKSSDSSSAGGGSCGGGGGSSSGDGLGTTILSLIIVIVVIWLGWKGVKGVWNWIFSGGGEADMMATITESWEKHLDQRREAFEDGLSENEVEAKGLRNYTLAEWEEKCLKEQEAKR